MIIKEGASDQSVNIRALDTTSGLPFTTLGGGTPGLQIWYRRDFSASAGVSAINISNLTTSHTDGGLIHINNGYYRFDIPDAAFSAGVDKVLIAGSATGVMILGQEIQLANYNPRELSTAKIDRLLSIDGLATSVVLSNTASNVDVVRLSLNGMATSTALNNVGINVSAIQLSLSTLEFVDGLATSAVLNEVVIDTRFIDGLATSSVLATVLLDTQAIDGLSTSAVLTLNNIRQQVSDGLSLINLDHLLSTSSVDTNVADGSFFAQLATSTGDFSSFNKENHSLQTIAGAAGLTQAQVRQQVDDALSAIHLDHLLAASSLDTNVVDGSIFSQLATSTGDFSSFNKEQFSLQTIAGAAGLTTSQVRQQVTEGLSAIGLDHLFSLSATAGDVTNGSFWAQMHSSAGSWDTFIKGTDSLESIRDRGDVAWTGGGSVDINGLATSAVLNTVLGNTLFINGLATSAALASVGTNVSAIQVSLSSLKNLDGLATSAVLATVLADTAFIDGLATSTVLTLANIRQQVSDGLSLIHLDHLFATSGVDTDLVTGSFFAQIATSSGDWSDFIKATDSLESIRNNTAWNTADVNGLATSAALATVFTNTTFINGLATSATLTGVGASIGAIQLSLSSVQTVLTAASNAEQNTQNIQTRLPATLLSGRMDSNVGSIAGNTDAANRQAIGASMMLVATAITGTLTTTCMTTNLTESTDDHFNGRTIIFTSGALKWQATDIVDYVGTTKMLVYTGLTEAPSNGTEFVIV